MANVSKESISKIERRLPRNKKMRKHLTRSAPLSNRNINKTSGASWTTLLGRRKPAAPRQYKSKEETVYHGEEYPRHRRTVIFSEVHKKRYTLAGEAPICNGALFQEFGYTASTPASKAVLDGTYVAPADSDSAAKELFAEIAAIWKLIPKFWYLSPSPQNNGNSIGRW